MMYQEGSQTKGAGGGLEFSYQFGLAKFQQTVRNNFELVQQLLSQHQESIDQLRVRNGLKVEPSILGKKKEGKKDELNPQANLKEGSQSRESHDENGPQSQAQDKQGKKGPVIKCSVPEESKEFYNTNKTGKQIDQSLNQNEIKTLVIPSVEQSDNKKAEQDVQKDDLAEGRSKVNIEVEASYLSKPPPVLSIDEAEYITPSGVSQLEQKAYETKIFQLYERVRKLEEKDLYDARQNAKAFKEFEYSLDTNEKAIQKNTRVHKDYQEQISKLRNELSQYKLKKQAKLNKLMHNSSNLGQSSAGNSNENYDYIVQKIQLLLKHMRIVLTKSEFETEKEEIDISFDVIRRKLKETISQQYFGQAMKNQQVKILTIMSKYIQAHSKQVKETGGDLDKEQNELNQIIEDGNKQFNEKVILHDQRIDELSEQINLLKSELALMRKERSKVDMENGEQFKQMSEYEHELKEKLSDLQRSHQQFKQNMGQKHLEAENQIIDLQEQVEKINSHIKTYTYSQPEGKIPVTPKNHREDSPRSPSAQDLQNNSGATLSLEQDIIILKKKVGKVNLKMQSVKEDFLSMRQEITRQLETMKMAMQKKADWDSLKKGLSFFEDKIKETRMIIEHLYNNDPKSEGDDSMAVKKGWTCLMCDRDIRNYEGKLSEAKFTSMFPVRDAPRIGGYAKQQQASQEYKQVFMNPRNNKRVSSIRSHQSSYSKEEPNS